MSDEYERLALAACLIDNAILDDSRLSAELFVDRHNQVVFEAMKGLHNGGAPVTIVTIADSMNGQLEKVGGAAFIATLSSEPDVTANIDFYIQQLAKDSRSRSLGELARDIETRRKDRQDPDEILQEIERKALELRQGSARLATVDNGACLHDLIERMQATSSGQRKGLRTGFAVLDRVIGDLEPGELILIGARPSVGKTALALSIMHKMISRGIRAAFVSLEMTRDQIFRRLVSMQAGIPIKRVKGFGAGSEDYQAVLEAAGELQLSPFALVDQSTMDVPTIRAWMVGQAAAGARIGFIDYAQLIRCENPRASRYERMTDVSGALKAMARECGIPLIVLCQLNRQSEQDGGREPQLSDLRDSGSWEQDADVVALLSRKKVDDEAFDSIPATLHVAKNRDGGTGYVKLMFRRSLTEFREGEDE